MGEEVGPIAKYKIYIKSLHESRLRILDVKIRAEISLEKSISLNAANMVDCLEILTMLSDIVYQPSN